MKKTSSKKKKSRKSKTPRVKVSKEERKQIRREKQRIIARNFRKRKKESLKRLEEEVKRLRTENDLHRKRLNLVQRQDPEEEKTKNIKMLSKLVEVEDETNLSHMKPVKIELKKFENSVDFHFEQLESLTPNDDISKMILLGLGNSDPLQQQKIWSEMLCPSTDMTNQQKSQLQGKDLSKSFRDMISVMKELKSIQSRFKTAIRDVHNAVSDVSDTFSAVQHSKHEIWMQTNDVSETLHRMWNANFAGEK